jgi:hypothetical protein
MSTLPPKSDIQVKEKTAFAAVFSGLDQFEALHATNFRSVGLAIPIPAYSQYLQGGKSRL